MATSILLTSGSDTVLPSPDDQTVNAVSQTLNPGDRLDAGSGYDELSLTGSGTFDLGALASFSGFESVNLTNATTAQATLYLRPGSGPTVTVGDGTTGPVSIYLANPSDVVAGGPEDDTFSIFGHPVDTLNGDARTTNAVVSGGGGSDTLYIGYASPLHGGTKTYDVSGASFSEIETLGFSTSLYGNIYVQVSATELIGLKTIQGSGGFSTAGLTTADTQLFLNGISFVTPYGSNLIVQSSNASGTTFHVDGLAQAQFVFGGPGLDTIDSGTVLSFADRQSLFTTNHIERVTDPTGTYRKLIEITTPAGYTNAAHVTITGTADASASGPVILSDATGRLGTVQISPDGTWTAPVTLAGEGSHVIVASVSDRAGDQDTSTVTLNLDTVRPAVSIATPSGVVTSATATLTGSAVNPSMPSSSEAGDQIQVYDGTNLVGSTTVGSDNQWIAQVTLTTDGAHTLVALATDGAGNSATSAPVTITRHIAQDATFNFGFLQSTVAYVHGEAMLTGPDGVTRDVTGIGHLHFTDGTINEADGSPLVDDLFYLSQYHDVYAAHLDPDQHYAQYGWKEGRDPDPYFSTNGYLAANPDVKASGTNPLQHYDLYGWQEGRDPGPNFSTKGYLAANPDVAQQGVDPVAALLNGQQGTKVTNQPTSIPHVITGDFDATYYLAHNPDVAASGIDPLQHFLTIGWKEGRDPDAYFSTKGYLAANPDVAAAGLDPLLHYEQYGWQEGRDPSGHFDTSGYLAANPDVAAAHVDPLQHFLQYGMAEGRHGWEI